MNDICFPPQNALLSAEQALSRISQTIQPLSGAEIVDLSRALGRTLAEDVFAAIDMPPQRNAAMDGYAFAAAGLSGAADFRLRMVGTAWAGKPFNGTLGLGECIRIFTGAVVPDAADSVVAQEQTRAEAEQISFFAPCLFQKNIRPAGSDFKADELLLRAPKKLTPRDIGLLAAAGIAAVKVRRRVRIGFFSTGDELAPLGAELDVGQIYDSNRYLLAAMLDDPNFEVHDLGTVKDDPLALEATLIGAAAYLDALVSTGGASVGDADYVKQVLEKCGQVNFWKLAIKPGKPLAFGKIGDCWYFGLPGNPVAVLVTYHKFVKPGLDCLLGALPRPPLQLRVRSDSQLRKVPGRSEYQRGILKQGENGELTVAAAGPQDSHQLKVASMANCFIVLDADCDGVSRGDWVLVEPFTLDL
ncbi:gephyrin-like molybdotransferase Glp [Methylomonas sp. DH-1]|uniref:molybdopterin molybdotransferase MoeA n=1 Tax=Methylomonas sp. (strain DH-1) TaxID=1727196 RepID=UPI0007C8C377|nr:gephyrin-like molybdotransferase Glp [Methylomonas sp. DH-1]ANE55574.1 molybdopterin molybdenumtransferase [Methylomonas sp. DH-1]